VVEFEGMNDRDYYLKKDPVHQAFAKKIGAIWTKGNIVDIELGVF